MANETSRMMTTEQVAEYLNVSMATLEQWRAQKRGPKVVRMGRRSVRYLKADLDEFVGVSRTATK